MACIVTGLVAALGACIVIASAAITGLRLHLLMERYAPGIAAAIPRDGLVLLGIAVGVLCVWRWMWP